MALTKKFFMVVALVGGTLSTTAFARINHDAPPAVGTLKFRFGKVSLMEDSISRKVIFTVSVCVQDPPKSLTVSRDGRQFDVRADGSQHPGCYNWKDSVTHKYYSPERFFKLTYSFDVDGTTRHIDSYVNPWDDKLTFGFDSREMADQTILSRSGSVPSIAASDLHLIKTEVEDNEVGLYILMSINVERTPAVLTNRTIKEPARDGLYWLDTKLANSDGQVLQSDKYLVQVKEGIVHTSISVPAKIARNSQLHVTVHPQIEFVRSNANLMNLTGRDMIPPESDLISPETVLSFQ